MAKRLFFELVIKIGDGVTGPNLHILSETGFKKNILCKLDIIIQ